MTLSLQDFFTFSSKYISRTSQVPWHHHSSSLSLTPRPGADIIAAGTVFAVASCGGPVMPFRGGRIDSYQADEMPVPTPDQDLATHTEIFRRQGFTPEEMIGLVACGHTMGGVKTKDEPNAFPANEPERIANFDTTKQFDNAVYVSSMFGSALADRDLTPSSVTEFVSGNTENPLVNVPSGNTTLASDQRIFNLDNGATMRSLAAPDAFQSTCSSLLTRMLNLVPRGVTLTDEITLIPAKVNAAQLTIERNQLVYKMTFRLAEKIGKSVSTKRKVMMQWCDRNGDHQNCQRGVARSSFPASKRTDSPDVSPITEKLGYYFVHYNFVVPIDPDKSILKFWVIVDEGDGTRPTKYDNEGACYSVEQDSVVFVPSMSHSELNATSTTSAKTFSLVAGVKSSLSPSRVYVSAYDSALPDYGLPLNTDIDFALNTSRPPVAGYTFYSGVVNDVGAQLTVDVHAVVDGQTYTEDYQQTYFLDTKIPSSPPTTVTEVSSAITKPSSAARTSRLNISGSGLAFGLSTWIFVSFLSFSWTYGL